MLLPPGAHRPQPSRGRGGWRPNSGPGGRLPHPDGQPDGPAPDRCTTRARLRAEMGTIPSHQPSSSTRRRGASTSPPDRRLRGCWRCCLRWRLLPSELSILLPDDLRARSARIRAPRRGADRQCRCVVRPSLPQPDSNRGGPSTYASDQRRCPCHRLRADLIDHVRFRVVIQVYLRAALGPQEHPVLVAVSGVDCNDLNARLEDAIEREDRAAARRLHEDGEANDCLD